MPETARDLVIETTTKNLGSVIGTLEEMLENAKKINVETIATMTDDDSSLVKMTSWLESVKRGTEAMSLGFLIFGVLSDSEANRNA